MDRIDFKILAELQADARLSIVELSRRVGLTKTPCAERLRRLEKSGVIRGYHADLDPDAIGAGHIVVVQVLLTSTTEQDLRRFNEAVRRIPEIESCHMIAGDPATRSRSARGHPCALAGDGVTRFRLPASGRRIPMWSWRWWEARSLPPAAGGLMGAGPSTVCRVSDVVRSHLGAAAWCNIPAIHPPPAGRQRLFKTDNPWSRTTTPPGPRRTGRQFLDNSCDIEKWFRTQWQDHMPPFYGSTDLRNSGFKLAPVDLNLFPGGFNNLNDAFMPLCVQAAQAAIERICPDASKLLLIPENHTRNQFYLQNVAKLVSILRLTGLDVRIGSLLPDIAEPTVLELANGATLTLEPLRRSGSRIGLDDFDPCAVLLNNDLSAGIPTVLKGLDEQWLIPPLHAGWHSRRKSKHAECYDRVARAFAEEIGIDPWRINPEFGVCGQINFQERTGEECLPLR